MSLADLLNNYSGEITARTQHNESVAQDNADRKATTLEERFEHAQSVVEGIGTELTSIGGAYHIGRKLYKKYQDKYGKKKAEDPASNDNPQTDAPADEGDEGSDPSRTGGQGEESSSTGGQEAPTDSQGSDANRPTNPDEEAQASAEAPTDEPVGEASAPAPAPATEGEPAFDLGSEASQAQRSCIADSLEQTQSADVIGGNDFGDEALRQAQARANEATQGAVDQLRQPEPKVFDEGAGDAPQGTTQTGDAPHGTTQTGEDSSNAVRQGAGDAEESAVRGAEQGANEGSTLTNDLTGALRSNVMNEADAGVGSILKNVASKAVSKVGGAIGDLGGLATTEGVLDALGPVGEVGGAIVGLVSLFEGLFHKPQEPKQGTGAVQTQVGGIDPTALAQKVPVVGEVI